MVIGTRLIVVHVLVIGVSWVRRWVVVCFCRAILQKRTRLLLVGTLLRTRSGEDRESVRLEGGRRNLVCAIRLGRRL